MVGEVFSGRLVSVNTDKGEILIRDRDNENRITSLKTDADTVLPLGHNWGGLLNFDVDAIVIDGMTKNVDIMVEEKQ